MVMGNSTQQQREIADFYLEHYKEMNNARSHTERNRLMVLGFYITLTAALLGFVYSSSAPNHSSEFPLVGILLVALGIVVARYFMVSRYWHCEHTEVAKAIRIMFEDDKPITLMEAAGVVEEINKSEKWKYYNFKGAEFLMYLFVLLLMLGNGYVTLLSFELKGIGKLILIILMALIILGVGFCWYRKYLESKQNEFPDKSPFIRNSVESQSSTKPNNQKEEGKGAK